MDNLIKLLHTLVDIDFFQATLSFILVMAFIVMQFNPPPNGSAENFKDIMSLVLGFWFGSKSVALKLQQVNSQSAKSGSKQNPLSE